MRLIIYTGKGGVGKTSTSAATAYRLSELGYRTLLMSTDSAHSLGDSLDMDLGTDIKNVRPNLDALEIDIIHEMRTKWKEIQNYVKEHTAPYKYPRIVVFRDQLPKTTSGKIIRNKL